MVEGGDVHRPCAHQPEDSPETISSGSDGLPEGEERTAAVRREPGLETPDWSGQDAVGSWVLCQYGRVERIGDPSVHKGSGRGRPVRRRVM